MGPDVARKRAIECEPLLREKKVLVVWGIKGGVGKSTISALLAYASSNIRSKKTLLVDTDFRDGASRFFLGEEARKLKGWYDVLIEGGTLDKFIHAVSPTLHVIPSGTLDSALKFSSLIAKEGVEKVARMVASTLLQIQEDYDQIILDSPVTSFADIPILKCNIQTLNADSVLLSQASLGEVQRTLNIAISVLGIKPVLFVINQVHPKILTDMTERRLIVAALINIIQKGIRAIAIPLHGSLYKEIRWRSSTVRAIVECLSFMLWGVGEPKSCILATSGLIDEDLIKQLSAARS